MHYVIMHFFIFQKKRRKRKKTGPPLLFDATCPHASSDPFSIISPLTFSFISFNLRYLKCILNFHHHLFTTSIKPILLSLNPNPNKNKQTKKCVLKVTVLSTAISSCDCSINEIERQFLQSSQEG